MLNSLNRRGFLKNSAAGAVLLGLGDVGFSGRIPVVSAADAKLDPKLVRLDSGIEPLVRLLEETPRDKLLEEVASRIKKGLSYREVVTALFLAGVRNIAPAGGGPFHALLVVHSAHQSSLAAPDTDRWLPIFWALDYFKEVLDKKIKEQADKRWRMAPVNEAKVPTARKARQAFLDAAAKSDAAAAEIAMTGLVRGCGAGEIHELLAVHGPRNFSHLGHNAIFMSNGWRTLECIGWQHAEPVLRTLTGTLIGFPPEDLWKGNRELVEKVPATWQEGKPNPDATIEMLGFMRKNSSAKTSEKAVEMLAKGVATQSIWDASYLAVAELMMRKPGFGSLHAATCLNAVRYTYGASGHNESRRLLFLHGAAIFPRFIERLGKIDGVSDESLWIENLKPASIQAEGAAAAEEIFTDVSKDKGLAARKTLSFLKSNQPRDLIEAARRLAIHKGADPTGHDYKFSVAAFEDYYLISPAWRDRYLASSMHLLRGAADKDNALVSRTRDALKS